MGPCVVKRTDEDPDSDEGDETKAAETTFNLKRRLSALSAQPRRVPIISSRMEHNKDMAQLNITKQRQIPALEPGDDIPILHSNVDSAFTRPSEGNDDQQMLSRADTRMTVMNIPMVPMTANNRENESECESLQLLYNARHKPLPCFHCDELFKTQGTYIKHMKEQHNDTTPYRCPSCSKPYKTLVGLKGHYRVAHVQKRSPWSRHPDNRRWRCPSCCKLIIGGKEWIRHNQEHATEGPVLPLQQNVAGRITEQENIIDLTEDAVNSRTEDNHQLPAMPSPGGSSVDMQQCSFSTNLSLPMLSPVHCSPDTEEREQASADVLGDLSRVGKVWTADEVKTLTLWKQTRKQSYQKIANILNRSTEEIIRRWDEEKMNYEDSEDDQDMEQETSDEESNDSMDQHEVDQRTRDQRDVPSRWRQVWTVDEVNTLKLLKQRGKSYEEIANEMNRNKGGIKRKWQKLQKNNDRNDDNQEPEQCHDDRTDDNQDMEQENINKATETSSIACSGDNVEVNDIEHDEDVDLDISVSSDSESETLHHSHDHPLSLMHRVDCLSIICDLCSKVFEGQSWHCSEGCDFDICTKCFGNNKSDQSTKKKQNVDGDSSVDLREDFRSFYNVNSNTLRCDECDKCFMTNKEFIHHMKAEHNEWRPYECHLCTKKYRQRKGLMDHYKTKHQHQKSDSSALIDFRSQESLPPEIAESTDERPRRRSARKRKRTEQGSESESRRRKIRRLNSDGVINSEFGLECSSESDDDSIPAVNQGPTSDPEYEPERDSEFEDESESESESESNVDLERESDFVADENDEDGDESVTRKDQNVDYKTYYNIHRDTLQCNRCNIGFESHKEFIKHMKEEHNDRKPYRCPLCSKKYGQRMCLMIHCERIHEKTPKYQCEFCDRSFYMKSEWLVHHRGHTGERPFECKECNVSFPMRNQFNNHLRKVHGRERRFQCEFCGKEFYGKSEWMSHKRAHSRERPFECIMCPKSFKYKRDLKKHKEKAHIDITPG